MKGQDTRRATRRRMRQGAARTIFLACMLLASGVVAVSTSDAAAATEPTCPVKEPIRLGDVSSMSGMFHFPESQQGAKATFDALNAECGVNGRPVEYIVFDDAGDETKSAARTQELVTRHGVVALVGGTSVVSCGTNASFITSQKIAAIPGAGAGPRCFDSPNISPPNAGFFGQVGTALKFGAEYLSAKKLCIIGNAHPTIPGNFRDPVARFERSSTLKVNIVNDQLRMGSDAEGPLAQLQAAGCDVAFVGTLADFHRKIAAALIKSSDRKLKLIFAPEPYTRQFAADLPSTLNGQIFAITDTDFLDSNSPGMKRTRDILTGAGIEISPFAVQGVLAAEIVISALKKMDGPITGESVLNALMKMAPLDTQGVTAEPYKFAWPASERATPGVRAVAFRDQAWHHATEDWIMLK